MTEQTLLDVIDDLTRSTFEHVAQKHYDKAQAKDVWTLVDVEIPGLLQQMRDAVMPSGELDGSGSASTLDSRAPGDLEAMFQYDQIAKGIAAWCAAAGVQPTKDAAVDLRAWNAATVADNTRDDAWYMRRLTGWRSVIRNHLERPRSFVIERPCPVCKTEGWGNAIDGGGRWPIEVRYRIEDQHGHTTMVDEVARCRAAACATVWYGHDAIIELAEEVTEQTVEWNPDTSYAQTGAFLPYMA